jgi:hypothetical protein
MDAVATQSLNDGLRLRMTVESKQGRAAERSGSGALKEIVQSSARRCEALARGCEPTVVAKRRTGDFDGWSGDGPRTEFIAQAIDEWSLCDCKPKPQSGKPVGLAEGSQQNRARREGGSETGV